MPKIVNWCEQKFFNLTIKLKLPIKNKQNRWLWVAVCDCGKSINVIPEQVRRGIPKHCGCKGRKTTAKNWSGQTIGRLTFIRPIGNMGQSDRILWEVLCDCGRKTNIIPYSVISGGTKSCGKCPRRRNFKDWTGFRSGRLIFIKPQKLYNDKMVWETKCDCGNTCYTIPSRRAKSCGCLTREKSKISGTKLGNLRPSPYAPDEQTARVVWNRYKKDGIDFDTFYKLSQLPCNYCGRSPFKVYKVYGGTFMYNGLDRVDSTIGHHFGNVVPCCYDCNIAKSDMSIDEFILHIKRIYNYLFKTLA